MKTTEGKIMRLDYTSYIVAVICFLFAGIVLGTTFATNPPFDATIATALTVVLSILGIILAGVGYSQRPKKTIPSTPTSTLPSEPTTPPAHTTPPPVPTIPAPTPIPIATPEPVPELTTATPVEETQKPQKEMKPKEKAVRRRRKKA